MRDMEKKRFYKVIRAFKHNGEIREFPFTLPYTFDEAYALAVDSTDYSVWDLIASTILILFHGPSKLISLPHQLKVILPKTSLAIV